MPKTFEEAIDEALSQEWHGDIISKSYNITVYGQRFVFVLTKYWWYGVRLYLHEDHLDRRVLKTYMRTEFYTRRGADDFINEYSRKFQTTEGIMAEYLDDRLPIYLGSDTKFLLTFEKMPCDCLADPGKYLKPGDYLQTSFVLNQTHDAIYYGCIDGKHKVIHVSRPEHQGDKSCAEAHIGEWKHFVGSFVSVLIFRLRLSTPEKVIERGLARANEHYGLAEYNVIFKNCQHFAWWCATGHSRDKFWQYSGKIFNVI